MNKTKQNLNSAVVGGGFEALGDIEVGACLRASGSAFRLSGLEFGIQGGG